MEGVQGGSQAQKTASLPGQRSTTARLPRHVSHESIPVKKKKKRYRFPPNNGSSDVSTGGILHIAYRLEGKGSQSMIKTNPSVPTS